jgi:hypothetical protein
MVASSTTRIDPPCPRCRDPMSYIRNIPAANSAPELHIYMCNRCGNVVTKEVADSPIYG